MVHNLSENSQSHDQMPGVAGKQVIISSSSLAHTEIFQSCWSYIMCIWFSFIIPPSIQ